MPYISVILPTHNRPVFLAEAIQSVREQSFQDWEILVVDDASTPAVTADWDDARIRVLRSDQGCGGAAAKNTGIEHARGELVAFLDDDDCYMPQYLERAIEMLSHHPEIDVVFMGVSWFGTNGQWGQANYDQAMARFLAGAGGHTQNGVTVFENALLPALLKSVPMAFQRPVVRKSALSRIGGYRPDCLLWDCDWAIRAALVARAGLIHEGLYRQRAEGQGYSSKRDRIIEHLLSGIDIRECLWRQSLEGKYPRNDKLFRHAVAEAWFNLAWHYYQNGKRWLAWRALWWSARRHPSISQLKLGIRLLLPMRRQIS